MVDHMLYFDQNIKRGFLAVLEVTTKTFMNLEGKDFPTFTKKKEH